MHGVQGDPVTYYRTMKHIRLKLGHCWSDTPGRVHGGPQVGEVERPTQIQTNP